AAPGVACLGALPGKASPTSPTTRRSGPANARRLTRTRWPCLATSSQAKWSAVAGGMQSQTRSQRTCGLAASSRTLRMRPSCRKCSSILTTPTNARGCSGTPPLATSSCTTLCWDSATSLLPREVTSRSQRASLVGGNRVCRL
ncbi:unnamed protein product, partial [Polarella glacialis]